MYLRNILNFRTASNTNMSLKSVTSIDFLETKDWKSKSTIINYCWNNGKPIFGCILIKQAFVKISTNYLIRYWQYFHIFLLKRQKLGRNLLKYMIDEAKWKLPNRFFYIAKNIVNVKIKGKISFFNHFLSLALIRPWNVRS